MNKKEEIIQKALGTFDHFKCVKCGKVTYKDKLIVTPIYETIRGLGSNTVFHECVGYTYQCICGSEEFE